MGAVQDFPAVDYRRHPAYQEGLDDDALRDQAVGILQPMLEQVYAKELKLPARRLEPRDDVDARFCEEGAVQMELSPLDLARLSDLNRDGADAIRVRLDTRRRKGKSLNFAASSRDLDPGVEPENRQAIHDALKPLRILERAARYFGAEGAVIHHVALRMNIPGESWHQPYADLGWQNPPLTGLHVDSGSAPYLKVLVYLSDVGPQNGPFSYISGSHLWPYSSYDRAARKAIDRCELSNRAPPGRRLFSALPEEFQRRADFGADVAADADCVEDLLADERLFTAKAGAAIMFDPQGAHRGGFVQEGSRTILQITVKALE